MASKEDWPRETGANPMKTVLKIELIGDAQRQRVRLYEGIIREAMGSGVARKIVGSPPSCGWCAEVSLDGYKIDRDFLKPKKDYSEANGVGSRGVYAYFYLDEGKIYEVYERTSWKSSERYFCKVKNGEVVKITEQEATRCLKNR